MNVSASHPRVLQLILPVVMAPGLSNHNTRDISTGSGGGSHMVLLTTDSSPVCKLHCSGIPWSQ